MDDRDSDVALVVVADRLQLRVGTNLSLTQIDHDGAFAGQGGVIERLKMSDGLIAASCKLDDERVAPSLLVHPG